MMSNSSQEVERVRQARCILERMRGRLLQPTFQALDSSAADLNLAVECLRQLDVSLKSPIWQGLARRKLEREVVALRQAVRSVEVLLKNAAKFYAGLARLLTPDEAPANYTSAGTSGAPSHASSGSVVVHG
jgi:hypothetical protein